MNNKKILLIILGSICVAQAHVPEDDPLTKKYKGLLRVAKFQLSTVDKVSERNKAIAASEDKMIHEFVVKLKRLDSIVQLQKSIKDRKASGDDVATCEQLFEDNLRDIVDGPLNKTVQLLMDYTNTIDTTLTELRENITTLKDSIQRDLEKRLESANFDDYRNEMEDMYELAMGLKDRIDTFVPYTWNSIQMTKAVKLIESYLIAPVNECLANDHVPEQRGNDVIED